MYFFVKKGKQFLDLRGNLILSHNNNPVSARSKRSAPRYVKNSKFVYGIPHFSFIRKIRTSWLAVRFIWGKSRAIDCGLINKENGLK